MSPINLETWLNATIEATKEVASQTLSCEGHSGRSVSGDSLTEISGSFLALVSESNSLQIGLGAHKDGLKLLSKMMMGMTPEEDLSDADMADAMGEIVNIVAGGVKSRLNEQCSSIKLGLPIFINGKIECGKNQESAITAIQLGDVAAYIFVIRKKD